ncbi:coil containing protein [Vibrio phage 1.124.O._10N.286.49.B1]|nr:coil containing protein [Vibrio phage 1.124.O._10N.286.49.B1]
MSLFDLSKELESGSDSLLESLHNKGSRDRVLEDAVKLQISAEKLGFIFSCSSDDSFREALDFMETAIDDLQERKKEIESKVLNSLIDGEDVHGFELKEGRITRSIAAKDQSEAVNTMTDYVDKDAMYDTKMIGIPAIEKLLKEQGMKKSQVDAITSKFITVKTGKPTLARTKI